MISAKRIEKIKQVVQKRQHGLTVVLEDIYDPHNAAAVLRSCDAFGVQEVYFIFKNQPEFNPRKVGKLSAASANKWLDFHIYHSSEECLSQLKEAGYTICATILDEEAQSIYDTEYKDKQIALLFGNEHSGLSKTAIQKADTKIYIPMRGFVQSFNLSVTASMLLFEVTRQRLSNGTLQELSPQNQKKLYEDFINK